MGMYVRRSIAAIIVGLLGFTSQPSDAQEAQPVLGAVSAREGEPLAEAVDPRTGAMSYRYPFELPAARGLSGPSLAIRYNSSLHDREAGYAWGLELPSIELRPLAGLAQFDSAGQPLPLGSARHFYQGQALVKVCAIGAGCPAEPSTAGHPSWAGAGWAYYRLQVEGLFARFYQSPDRATWRVQFKGGEVLDFGAPSDGAYGVPSAVETKGLGIVRWRPVLRRDVEHSNNVVVYRWGSIGARGLQYLTDIYDTPAVATPTTLASFAHHTQLSWEAHGFVSGSYQNAERAAPDLRLRRVAVSSMPWSGVAPREVYRIYTLDYFAPRGAGTYNSSAQGPLWHHSFLKQISLQGHCRGQWEAGDGSVPVTATCTASPARVMRVWLASFMGRSDHA